MSISIIGIDQNIEKDEKLIMVGPHRKDSIQIKQYVLIGIFSRDLQEVILVLKDRPDWQKGRLNLVGGKIEENELSYDAAMREMHEETGLFCSIILNGKIIGNDFEVFCYSGISDKKEISQVIGETESVTWYSLPDILSDSRLIENLKTIIPAMLNNSIGWTIKE